MAGSYIAAVFSDSTVKDLENYIRYYSIPNPIPAEDLHATIFGTEQRYNLKDQIDVPQDNCVREVLNPCDYKFTILGDCNNVLALKLNSFYLINRHFHYRNCLGLKPIDMIKDYLPHISLTCEINEDLDPSILQLPDFPIEIIGEYCQPLKD